VEVVAMDGFTGFKTATTEELPDAVAVMDPFNVVRLAGDALDRCRRRVLRSIQQKSTASEGRQHVLDTLAWLTPQLAGLELPRGEGGGGELSWIAREAVRVPAALPADLAPAPGLEAIQRAPLPLAFSCEVGAAAPPVDHRACDDAEPR